MEEGRIIKALSGFYYVQTENGVVECRARGRFRKEGTSPLVGDRVSIVREQGKGTVDAILPRRNALIRPAVANVDVLVVLASCAIPQTEPFLIDRILTIAARLRAIGDSLAKSDTDRIKQSDYYKLSDELLAAAGEEPKGGDRLDGTGNL